MDTIISIVAVILATFFVVLRKKNTTGKGQQTNVQALNRQLIFGQQGSSDSSAMPHMHRPNGQYDTFNKKTKYNTAGAQPHVHSSMKYKPMPDINTLPKGYILLNGEPVRVADLEGK